MRLFLFSLLQYTIFRFLCYRNIPLVRNIDLSSMFVCQFISTVSYVEECIFIEVFLLWILSDDP